MIAVIFEADVHPQAGERYLQLASELKLLLAEIPGFISIERFQSINTPGKCCHFHGGRMRMQCAGGNATSGIRPHNRRVSS